MQEIRSNGQNYLRATNRGSKNLQIFNQWKDEFFWSIFTFFWDCRSMKLSRLFSGNLPAMFFFKFKEFELYWSAVFLRLEDQFWCSAFIDIFGMCLRQDVKVIEERLILWSCRTSFRFNANFCIQRFSYFSELVKVWSIFDYLEQILNSFFTCFSLFCLALRFFEAVIVFFVFLYPLENYWIEMSGSSSLTQY